MGMKRTMHSKMKGEKEMRQSRIRNTTKKRKKIKKGEGKKSYTVHNPLLSIHPTHHHFIPL